MGYFSVLDDLHCLLLSHISAGLVAKVISNLRLKQPQNGLSGLDCTAQGKEDDPASFSTRNVRVLMLPSPPSRDTTLRSSKANRV